ncbi:hypothetical protein TWF718_006445 [Orbilia javanica]|uniref:F-box domain-containing protein n=1 Tax=Orbilia javanica TaxID=47235 RepID=A0AAN8RPQ9_9PEZI
MLNLNYFPTELLDMVFDYLNIIDQISASQVCFRWEGIINNRSKITRKRYKRFYCFHTKVPQRIHRLLALNESWFMDHEDPKTDPVVGSSVFTRGSNTSQVWLKFTIKDFRIDRYIGETWNRENKYTEWRSDARDITDHCILDEPLFSKDTIAATVEQRDPLVSENLPVRWEDLPVTVENLMWCNDFPFDMQFLESREEDEIEPVNNIIARETRKVIMRSEDQSSAEIDNDKYFRYNFHKASPCGCRLKLLFTLGSMRYLNMTLREFFQDIWEQTKVWMFAHHHDKWGLDHMDPIDHVDPTGNCGRPEDTKFDYEISNFPEISSATIELKYGRDHDMIVILRAVRKGKGTYKDGCSQCIGLPGHAWSSYRSCSRLPILNESTYIPTPCIKPRTHLGFCALIVTTSDSDEDRSADIDSNGYSDGYSTEYSNEDSNEDGHQDSGNTFFLVQTVVWPPGYDPNWHRETRSKLDSRLDQNNDS